MPVETVEKTEGLRQVMEICLETTKAELFTMDMFPPIRDVRRRWTS